jgi:putative transposase
MTQKSHKFRIEPTAAQRAQLAVEFGHARWAWNTCLAWRIAAYRLDGESLTGVDFSRDLTWLKGFPGYEWLNDATAGVLVQKLRDQDRAFANFFAGRAKFPSFKKKSHAQSIRYQLDQRVVAGMYRPGALLKLPKLGALKVRWSRVPGGIPKMVTLGKDALGRYFVSFMCEEQVIALPPKTNAVGIDLGVKDVTVTSDGQKSGNPRHLRRYLRKLKLEGRKLSRKRKGSARWHRQRIRVAKVHAKVAATRADFLHKTTTALIRENGLLAIEDLNAKGMMANRALAQAIGDVGMGELRRQLEYKADWYGRDLAVIDRWEPTSKVCSACGHKMAQMPLKIRDWTCPECGAAHDRDVNAAKCVLQAAMVGRTKCSAKSASARGAGHPPNATGLRAAA